MRLIILGSSSKGNCYLLDNGKEALMIECGISFKEVQKAVNFDVSRIKGVIITHEHQDHAKHVEKCLKSRIPVYCSTGTAAELQICGDLVHPLDELKTYQLGNFFVMPYNTHHDCREPFGYYIHHPECGNVLFATDTYYIDYTFPNLNHILIECNYKQEYLDENVANKTLHPKVAKRIAQSHMEMETTKNTLLANDLRQVNEIILIHLSEGNANEQVFCKEIEKATGVRTSVAHPGDVIENFNIKPF